MKLLYAEDEQAMVDAVAGILEYHKYTVDTVDNGEDALQALRSGQYDGAILDIMMPRLSGLEVLQQMRQEGNDIPVLLLTAKTQVEDRIAGLDLGADDYLPKPFDMGELLARIRAMLRRRNNFTPDIVAFGDMTLNRQNNQLSCGTETVTLPRIEFQIMEMLMLNTGRLVSTEEILRKVWGFDTEAEVGIVWVYLTYLRRRLGAISSKVRIQAKRGVGYMLMEE